MSGELLAMLGQFGPAGLIGLLWIIERRFASRRDRQLAQAHSKLLRNHRSIDLLLNVVRDNTRAIATLEHTQRQLIEALKK